jgi:lipopolysaccharide export system protein LptA
VFKLVLESLVRGALFFIFSCLLATLALAQRPGSNPEEKRISGEIKVPTEEKSKTDTLPKPKSDIETTIKYSARDSINFRMKGRILKLYGDAHIDYGTIELEADEITIDYVNNTITANGRLDSLGRRVGYPIFKDGTDMYETKDIVYNFKTKKARISEVVTTQGEGFLHGKTVYKNENDEIFSINNTYTTCNLAHPHFRIRSSRTKAIPNDKIVSGPFNLEINDVPTPLGFAFGMFPNKMKASSGLIIPSYGEERLRGFFLRGGGYFFDISEYVKLSVTGDIYTKGGHGLQVRTPYNKRYAYGGDFSFTYNQLRISQNIEDKDVQNDYRIMWSHRPQTKGTGRFSAQVNAATATFNQNNNLNNPMAQITAKLNSSVTYSKTFAGTPFSMGLNGRFAQDVRTREVDLLLPEVSFNMQNIYPLKSDKRQNPAWVDKLTMRYSMNGTNRVSNNLGRIGGGPLIAGVPSEAPRDSIAPFDFTTLPGLLADSRKGFQHQIPISTSFKLFKHFTLGPQFNFQERWYFEKLDWRYDPELKRAVSDTISGFNRVYQYNFSTGLNTWVYGTFFFKKGKVKAIRHSINPSLSFNMQPNFGESKYDFYQYVQTNERGDFRYLSRHQGYVYGSAPIGKQGAIGLSVNNILEAKVKAEGDTARQDKKVQLLNNFGFSTSYNLAVDSFNLAPISLRANTNLFDNKLSVNLTGTVNPYIYQLDSIRLNANSERVYYQRRRNEFAWNNGKGLGQLTNANLALSTSLNPKARENNANARDRIQGSDLSDADKQYLLNNPETYVDFSIPWDLAISYSLNYTKDGFRDAVITQSLTFNGNLSLSEHWKVRFGSGYDFQQNEFTYTNIGIARDLHCWEMNFDWTPFGRLTSYNFVIRAKSSLLQDLKINRTRSFWDRSAF